MAPHLDSAPLLVPDGIENPKNAKALLDAASMFGCPVMFRDTAGLSQRWRDDAGGGPLPTTTLEGILGAGHPIVAIENEPGSASIFGATPLRDETTVVVGNERRGIGRDLLSAASRTLRIPAASRGLNTLNVAAAAAVSLFYLSGRPGGEARRVRKPERRRPSLLLLAPADHVEAGSTLRSAAAFGWRTAAIEDRHHVWFGTRRAERTEGRAAARSYRSALRVVPVEPNAQRFEDVVVATSSTEAPPLRRVRLHTGPGSLLVVPDESGVKLDAEDWGRFGHRIRSVQLDLPERLFHYRYRLASSIILAETARQIGVRGGRGAPQRGGTRGYESAIRLGTFSEGETLTWEDLSSY